MPLLSDQDPLPGCPRRIAVSGTSGAGKTTLASTIGELLKAPHIEIDALFHGPDWKPLPTFIDDVRHFVAEPAWVTEWQYGQARDLIAARAQLLVWLDLSRARVMEQVGRRTLRRRLRRQPLWNGNVEAPLWTVFTSQDHIVRWAWSSHPQNRIRMFELLQRRPDLDIVRLPTRRAVQRWVSGPLREVVNRCASV